MKNYTITVNGNVQHRQRLRRQHRQQLRRRLRRQQHRRRLLQAQAP